MLPKLIGHCPKSSHSSVSSEGRSPLNCIMTVFLSDFKYFIEKKFGLLAKVWISNFNVPKLLLRVQNLGAKLPKSATCRHFGSLSPLDFGHYTNNENCVVTLYIFEMF